MGWDGERMKGKAKKMWAFGIDAAVISLLLMFHVAFIVVIGVAMLPFIGWRLLKGEEI